MRETTGTVTAEGFIPHAEVFFDCGIVRAPVKLVTAASVGTRMQREHGLATRGYEPVPERRGGALVYALPGGGEWIE